MDYPEIRHEISWLYHNGFKDEVNDFLDTLRVLNEFAVAIYYSEEPADWTSILQRKCRKLQRLDSVYYSCKNVHLFRTFNAKEKEDMIAWVKEINDTVNY